MFPTLETERLILREITKEDREGIFAYFSNDDVTRYYGQETLQNLKQAEDIIGLFRKNYHDKRGIRWAIERKEDKGIIGTIGFNAWLPKHKRAEIGYELHPNHWRKGYISEAVLAVLAYGFDVMELTRVGAIVFKENEASQNLLTKIGFQEEGTLKKYMYQNGVAHDTYVYSLLKDI